MWKETTGRADSATSARPGALQLAAAVTMPVRIARRLGVNR